MCVKINTIGRLTFALQLCEFPKYCFWAQIYSDIHSNLLFDTIIEQIQKFIHGYEYHTLNPV